MKSTNKKILGVALLLGGIAYMSKKPASKNWVVYVDPGDVAEDNPDITPREDFDPNNVPINGWQNRL